MTLATLPYRLGPGDLDAARAAGPTGSMSILGFVAAATVFGTVIGLGAASIVARAVAETRYEDAVPGGTAGWFALAATVGLLAVVARRADATTRATRDRPMPEQRIEFSPDGLHFVAEHGEGVTRWSGIAAVRRRGDDLIFEGVYGELHVVPARALPDPRLAAAIEAFATERIAGRPADRAG